MQNKFTIPPISAVDRALADALKILSLVCLVIGLWTVLALAWNIQIGKATGKPLIAFLIGIFTVCWASIVYVAARALELLHQIHAILSRLKPRP